MYKINVSAGQVITIMYHLTKVRGYVYDGRSCGLGYQLSNNVVNAETMVTLTIPQNGTITFSDIHNTKQANGNVTTPLNDALYGKYYAVKIGG